MQTTLERPVEITIDTEAARPSIERVADELLVDAAKRSKIATVPGAAGMQRGSTTRESRAWSVSGQID